MKLKMKMSMLAGAVALAAVGQAYAAPSDLFLTVDDTTTGQVYARDLAVNYSTFQSLITGSGATLAAASDGNHTYAADANLTSFLTGVGLTDQVVWNVTASVVGAASPNAESFMATTNVAAIPTSQKNSSLTNVIANFGSYDTAMGAVYSNGLTSGSQLATSTNNIVALGQTGGGQLKFTTVAALGSSMDMMYVTPSSTSGLGNASGVFFGGAGSNADVWTLNSAGTLTVASVAAVPEPGEWLLMLSGLGLIGFVATRRKNQGSALNFA